MTLRKLSSFESLHRLLPALVKRLSADTALAVRAMANPVFAIAELGFELSPEVAREVERRARIPSAEDRKRAAALEDQLRDEVKYKGFDPDCSDQIEELLFKHLQLERPPELKSIDPPRQELRVTRPMLEPRARKLDESPRVHDPLELLRGKHPIVDLLLAYRAITLRVPPFASREDYERLKRMPKGIPLQKIQITLPEHPGADHA